jgi:hypothetical protein
LFSGGIPEQLTGLFVRFLLLYKHDKMLQQATTPPSPVLKGRMRAMLLRHKLMITNMTTMKHFIVFVQLNYGNTGITDMMGIDATNEDEAEVKASVILNKRDDIIDWMIMDIVEAE